MTDFGYRIDVRALSAAEGGGYLATVPELPGCMSDGATADDARANARDAIAAWLDAASGMGREIPRPARVPA